jgi:hypothetical protein
VRRAWLLAALAAAVVTALTGCGLLGHGPDPQPVRSPVTTSAAAVIPDELAGMVWGRITDTMEVDLKILADGRYRSVEIYSPSESGGVYQLQRVEDGVATVSGNRVRLAGSKATVKRSAADDPSGDYERSADTRTGVYTWAIQGNELHLTDANGDDAVFTRQNS